MGHIALIAGYMILGLVLWGCFTLIAGIAKPPRGPFVIGWKARMLGLLAIMSIPVSWTLGYAIVFVTMWIGASPSGELIVIAADAGAFIAVFAAMHYFSWRWERMDRVPDNSTSETSRLGSI